MNKIFYQIKALKQLRKIQRNELIRNKIDDLANMPIHNMKRAKQLERQLESK